MLMWSICLICNFCVFINIGIVHTFRNGHAHCLLQTGYQQQHGDGESVVCEFKTTNCERWKFKKMSWSKT